MRTQPKMPHLRRLLRATGRTQEAPQKPGGHARGGQRNPAQEMRASLDGYAVKGARAKAAVLKTLVTVIRDRSQYRHGLTANEMRYFFPTVMHFTLATYGNRLRDLVNEREPRAGRHDVHNERHFYPKILDEQGLIDHTKCINCEKPK